MSKKSKSITSTWRANSDAPPIPPPPVLFAPPENHLQVGPFQPFAAFTTRGSDFLVQHFCGRCQQPRSVQYHRENPIPPGVPPPPASICGRCRREVDHQAPTAGGLVGWAQSGHDVVSRREERRSRSEAPASSGRISIHLNQVVHTAEAVSSTQRVMSHHNAAQHVHDASSAALPKTDPTSKRSSTKRPSASTSPESPSLAEPRPLQTSAPSQALDSILESKTKDWVEKQSFTSSAKSGPSGFATSAAYEIAASASSPLVPKSESESTIRRIAREEVVKYRHAERKLEQHPKPFCHGVGVASDHGATSSPVPSEISISKPPSGKGDKILDHWPSSPRPDASSGKSTSKISIRSRFESRENSNQAANAKAAPSTESESKGQPAELRRSSAHAEGGKKYVGDRHHSAHKYNGDAPQNQSSRGIAQSGIDHQSRARPRRSLETAYTVHPGSSISQQKPVDYSQISYDRSSIDKKLAGHQDVPKNTANFRSDRDQAVPSHHQQGFQDASRSRGEDSSAHRQHIVSSPPTTGARVPRWEVKEQSRRAETTPLPRKAPSQASAPAPISPPHPPCPPAPPSRPSAPPLPPSGQRLADDAWTYTEEISPHRVRMVRERLIRSRPVSPEQVVETPEPRKVKVKRYEIVESVRSVPSERGRAKVREEEEKPKKKQLRGILRSPGVGRYDPRDRSSETVARRVSFSEAIDVTMLSPPPSSSNLESAVQGGRRNHGDGGSYRHGTDGASEQEKCYFERARRPDPEEIRRARQLPDSEPSDIDRRRALARALSESPSRERMLTYPMPNMGNGSDHSDGLGPYAPFLSPTSSMVSRDEREPIVVSGGLSSISIPRSTSGRTQPPSERAVHHASVSSRARSQRQGDFRSRATTPEQAVGAESYRHEPPPRYDGERPRAVSDYHVYGRTSGSAATDRGGSVARGSRSQHGEGKRYSSYDPVDRSEQGRVSSKARESGWTRSDRRASRHGGGGQRDARDGVRWDDRYSEGSSRRW